jgi:hypothetical protein
MGLPVHQASHGVWAHCRQKDFDVLNLDVQGRALYWRKALECTLCVE